MSSKNLLDSQLHTLSKKRVSGDVGIEIELEGHLSIPEGNYWAYKTEGSLRQHPHGYEYILAKPLPIGMLDPALEEIEKVFKESKPFLSIRCSTHIHVNVLRKTLRQIYNFLGYYYLIEDFLVGTQGQMRCGNLFCLRMSDAESLSNDIAHSIKSKDYFRMFSQGLFKYGACNLASPYKYGSIEFRFLRPIIDTKVLKLWTTLLYQLVNRAADIPLRDTLRFAKESDPMTFLQLVFDDEQINFLLTYGATPFTKESILRNYDHVRVFQKAMDRQTKYKVPPAFQESDIERGVPNPLPFSVNVSSDLDIALTPILHDNEPDFEESESDFVGIDDDEEF